MIIGFDAKRFFHNFSGLGNYSRTLIDALSKTETSHTLRLYTPRDNQHPLIDPIIQRSNVEIIRPQGSGFFWRSKRMTRQFSGLDIYHGLSHELPLGIKRKSVKSVVTIHDLIYHHFPKDFPWIDRKIYDFKFRYACKNADHIVAISESTKQDIITLFGISPEKITVIYQPVHQLFHRKKSEAEQSVVSQSFNLPSVYNLYVGSTLPRKNLINVLKAHDRIERSNRRPLVVLAGGNQNKLFRLKKSFKRLKDVLFLGHMDLNHLPAIYQMATLTLYPSKYEGFGLPVVESLMMGTPVVTSNTSSLPEALGPGGIQVDPNDVLQIKNAIIELQNNQTMGDEMILAAQKHLPKFSIQDSVQAYLDVYQQLL